MITHANILFDRPPIFAAPIGLLIDNLIMSIENPVEIVREIPQKNPRMQLKADLWKYLHDKGPMSRKRLAKSIGRDEKDIQPLLSELKRKHKAKNDDGRWAAL